MLSRTKIVSAMAGIAMLAVPVSALAGHARDFRGRPNASHDQGWHQGWFKHARDDDRFRRPDFEDRDWSNQVRRGGPRTGYWTPAPYRPAPRPVYYNNEPDADDYGAPALNCGSGWNGYNYGQPFSYYEGLPPAGYNSSQQVAWLLQRRQQAYVVLANMRARHDRNAANRMLTVINNLNARISGLNHRNAYAPAAGYPYAANPLGGIYNSYGSAYNPGYAPSAYAGTNPMLSTLGGVVGPLLNLPY